MSKQLVSINDNALLGSLTLPSEGSTYISALNTLEQIQQNFQWTSPRSETETTSIALGQKVEKICRKLCELVNERANVNLLQHKRIKDLIVRIAETNSLETIDDPMLSTQALLQIAIYINSCQQ